MKFSRVILPICILVASFPAMAKDNLRYTGNILSVYQNAEKIMIKPSDEHIISERLVKTFNENTADTSEVWFKHELEKHGKTLQDQWNEMNADGSFFSLRYYSRGVPKSKSKYYIEAQEVRLRFFNTAKDGYFGLMMAQERSTNEIKAYKIPNEFLASFYCYTNVVKYLPDHYNNLVEKYAIEEYKDSGISCNKETDDYIEEKQAKKDAKSRKWRELREKRYGKSVSEEDQDGDGEIDEDSEVYEESEDSDEAGTAESKQPVNNTNE